jgi:hypothetical protein
MKKLCFMSGFVCGFAAVQDRGYYEVHIADH